MDWAIIGDILGKVIVILVSSIVLFFINYIKKKNLLKDCNDSIKNAYDALYDCVLFVKQTYVDDLKAAGKWNNETAKIAKIKCVKAFQTILNESEKAAIEYLYNSLDTWVDVSIESIVNQTKGE